MQSRQKGLDRGQFSALYEEEADGLLVFLTRRTLDPETALDLWSEALALAFENRGKFRGDRSQAPAWLYGIAYRQLALFWRKGSAERRALRRIGLERPNPGDDQLDELVHAAGLQELRAQLMPALERLPQPQRVAIRLRVIEELPYAEVAARLGLREDAARARVSRALRGLAQHISDYPTAITEVTK